jgi:hypothetical protein
MAPAVLDAQTAQYGVLVATVGTSVRLVEANIRTFPLNASRTY